MFYLSDKDLDTVCPRFLLPGGVKREKPLTHPVPTFLHVATLGIKDKSKKPVIDDPSLPPSFLCTSCIYMYRKAFWK